MAFKKAFRTEVGFDEEKPLSPVICIFRSIGQEKKYILELSNITTNIYKFKLCGSSQFPIPKVGKLLRIGILCDSTDYNISLRSKENTILPSTEEILKVCNIDRIYQNNLDTFYCNKDDDNYLHLLFENNDIISRSEGIIVYKPTGIIKLDLIISEM